MHHQLLLDDLEAHPNQDEQVHLEVLLVVEVEEHREGLQEYMVGQLEEQPEVADDLQVEDQL